MAQHTHTEPDPRQLENAQKFWGNFMQITKYGAIGIAVTLILLALAFTDLI